MACWVTTPWAGNKGEIHRTVPTLYFITPLLHYSDYICIIINGNTRTLLLTPRFSVYLQQLTVAYVRNKFPRLSWSPKFESRVQRNPPMDLILSQTNPDYIPTPFCFNIHFNIISSVAVSQEIPWHQLPRLKWFLWNGDWQNSQVLVIKAAKVSLKLGSVFEPTH